MHRRVLKRAHGIAIQLQRVGAIPGQGGDDEMAAARRITMVTRTHCCAGSPPDESFLQLP